MEGWSGVAAGQLYFLIKELKTPADTQSEDQLKISLLNLMFGEGKVHVKKHSNGKDYYCASITDWTKMLGKAPKLNDV